MRGMRTPTCEDVLAVGPGAQRRICDGVLAVAASKRRERNTHTRKFTDTKYIHRKGHPTTLLFPALQKNSCIRVISKKSYDSLQIKTSWIIIG